ncbi:hypothetical protein GCM10023147_16210 [Tsukamurella soli]|uniref:PAP2 superfamily protein n=1 Tax=Tsukamurella soli TaxID=644556 RepID=A0ABP8JE71_9ACTN
MTNSLLDRRAPRGRAGAGDALAAAAASIVLLGSAIAVYLVGVDTYPGQVADQTVMTLVSGAFGVSEPTHGLLGEWQGPGMVVAGAALLITCLARPSRRRLTEAAVTVLASVAGAVLLKYGLGRPGYDVGPLVNSFPSNTVAVFAGLGFALVAAVPRAARGWAAAVTAVVVAVVSMGVVALQWHRPSDVLGALLIAGAAAAGARAMCSGLPGPRD